MKANAPEKIYLHIRPNKEIGCTWHGNKIGDTDIEYIRTNTFIEKAVEWIKEHKENVETEDNGIMGWIPDYFIEDFRKYMEGE